MAFTRNILEMFDKIKKTVDLIENDKENDFESNIRFLAKKEVTLKGMVCFEDIYSKSETVYILSLLSKLEAILDPVFEKIVDTAFNHYLKWFSTVTTDGDKTTELSQTQLKMVYWLLYGTIRKKSISDIYSVCMPRGGGKSYLIASLAIFLAYEHEKYCINKTDNKYVILITSPSDDNLTQFLSYVRDFAERTDMKCNTGVDLSRNSDDLIRLRKNNITYSDVYFKLAGKNAKSIEGVHCEVLFADEFKMVEKHSWDTSILPTLNGKMGVGFVISSTDEFYTFFQSICESNMRKEKQDGKIRHFQGNLNRMIRERPEYALVVHRAKEQLGENSIAYRTQYKCEFIGMKRESFFNISELDDLGIFQLEYDSPLFLNNPSFVCVGGWDYAPINDNSLLTIKAVENGYGQLRRAYLIKQIVLNKEHSSQINTPTNQINDLLYYIKKYNIQALALDSTGVGANLRELIIEKLIDRDDIEIDLNMITEIKFNEQNRIEMLDNYMNRLNSRYEILFTIDKELVQLDILKKYYNNILNSHDEESDKIRFLYEHAKFSRSIKLLTDGKSKVVFRQAEEYRLRDDTVFSSVLASHNLVLFPNISYIEAGTGMANYYESDNVNFYRT